MSFRIKITKNKDKLYAALIEEFYNPVIKRSSNRTLKTYGDLNERRIIEPNIDLQMQKDLEELRQREETSRLLREEDLKALAVKYQEESFP